MDSLGPGRTPVWKNVPLRPYTTLRAGGAAERLAAVRSADELADVAAHVQQAGTGMAILGSGSNVLPSDDGVPGLVVLNLARGITIGADGEVEADTGVPFQDLFLKTVQSGLSGFEYAVGIPGTVGGALVSNAGAYRSNVSEFLTEVEVVRQGRREWLQPDVLRFSYRNSILRRPSPPNWVVVRVRFRLPRGNAKASYDEAREYQRQRISKQPPAASAGSFFKNVENRELAGRLPGLPDGLRAAGVVPAGYLIEASGLKGFSQGGAMFAPRHANFIVNVRGATATAIRNLAEHAKSRVREDFGVELEEEVLYLGDWSRYPAAR